MDNNNRPHSREKTTVSGSTGVSKGSKAPTGGRPVGTGSGGRRPGSSSSGSRSGSSRDSSGVDVVRGFMNLPKGLRTILLVVIVIAVIWFFVKGGSGSGGGLLSGLLGGGDSGDSGLSYTDPFDTGTGTGTGTGAGLNTDQSAYTGDDNSADMTVSNLARDKRVIPLGSGRDTVTIMVYMCGTDLESKYSMATKDLVEMTKASISDKVNLIVETGGCKQWKNELVSSSTNQIWKVSSGGLTPLEKDLGAKAMTDPATLTSFIKYCTANYPADRNILIFWDHGGGSLTGYGYDEKFPSSSSMTLTGISKALKDGGCTYDWIGFDACLMATLETALVCNDYADYLIASEETEPGTGWDYTGWLNALSKNTSISTVELSKVLIDDFVSASTAASSRAQVTLSIIDLAELQGTVPAAFRNFATSTSELIQGNDYTQVSNARAGARQFAESSRINQVDLIDLAQRMDTREGTDLAKALAGCVKYNRTTISRANGVSIFFPYESRNSMNGAVKTYNSLGMDSEYTKCIQAFASLEHGGQVAASASQSDLLGSVGSSDLLGSLLTSYLGGGSTGSASSSSSSAGGGMTSMMGSLMGSFLNSSGSSSAGSSLGIGDVMGLLGAFSGRSMPQELSWVDTDLIAGHAQQIAGAYIDPGRITITEKNGHPVLALTEEEWALIQTVELNVYVDDGEGFIDMGLDNTFDLTDDGDLLLEYDGTWLTLNGHAVAYYLVSDTENADGSWTTVGRIPVLLNGEPMNLQVVFRGSDARVTGAYPLYDGETDTQAKGMVELQDGDVIQPLCDYYDYNGQFSDSYTLGESFTVQGSLTVANMRLDVRGVSVTWRLTDVYGNHYWTPAMDY